MPSALGVPAGQPGSRGPAPWLGGEPRTLGAPASTAGARRVHAAQRSRASRVSGAVIPDAGGTPTGARLTPAPPRPPWGGSAQRVSGVLPEAAPGRSDLSAAAPRRRQLPSGGCPVPCSRSRPARASAPPGARTMLCCLLARASNLPSEKKDRRSDPVASLTFRGESPWAPRPRHPVLPTQRAVCGPGSSANPSPRRSLLPWSAGTGISALTYAEGEEDAPERGARHSALKFWKSECAVMSTVTAF